ncbi:MAG: molybdate ABC transporter substrate-binding protein [Lawsonibacter sp.]|nr:molybdate ABC transporter substrate-binding protein [Lawsonibacter sp.]
MKKLFTLTLALAMTLSLAACGSKPQNSPAQPGAGSASSTPGTSASQPEPTADPVEIFVFAAASMTETLNEIIEVYKTEAPNVTVTPTYDSSGTLLTQIQEGAECDLFLSAAQKQMNTLEKESALLEGTRLDLLENKVTLAVPEGNSKGIESFDQLAGLLKSGGVLLAMGNSDVPVGQYTQKIFDYYQLDEGAMAAAGVLTYGSNVKEVTTQISEATVDCGLIYGTDAASANLTVVDSATAEMCGQVIYPAAVLADSKHPDETKAFLDYLQTDACGQIFERVGFSPLF